MSDSTELFNALLAVVRGESNGRVIGYTLPPIRLADEVSTLPSINQWFGRTTVYQHTELSSTTCGSISGCGSRFCD
jgi:hypothetical protein